MGRSVEELRFPATIRSRTYVDGKKRVKKEVLYIVIPKILRDRVRVGETVEVIIRRID